MRMRDDPFSSHVPVEIHRESKTMRSLIVVLSVLTTVPVSLADNFHSAAPCPLAAGSVSQHETGLKGPSNPVPRLLPHDSASTPLGLGGFCPVCLVKGSRWERGTEQFQTVYDGITWRFPNNEAMEMFRKNPAAFVPALNGDCIVCFANAGKRMPGDIRLGVFYQNRVFLFPSPLERDEFVANPARYADADLALNGNCVVCRVKTGKDMPGQPEFTEIHNGLRYQFPSAGEQQMFREQPSLFVSEVPPGVSSTADSAPIATPRITAERTLVSFQGSAACAACELGVRPLVHPGELGMALRTDDGRTVVIEEAHLRFPAEYKARFSHHQYEVQGVVIRSEGHITWISPSSLTRVR
jgi:YHS domain-containing protein